MDFSHRMMYNIFRKLQERKAVLSMEHELRIAVVDDMEQDRIQIMEETDAILSRAKIAHSIDCYADAEVLLDAIQGGRKYHLLLLDVLMDEMDGMALAAELRKEGDPAAIIFISISQEMADAFVRQHLLNPQEFWTPLPLPSVAVNDPMFRNAPENNWSGQCEGLTYQRAIIALERYGYEPLVTKLGRKLLDAIIRGGYVFTQQFDPFTGEPSRVGMVSHEVLSRDSDEPFQDSYGPTLLAALEYIAHIWGIALVGDEVWFSLGSGLSYTYAQRFGDDVYEIKSDGRSGSIYKNRITVGSAPCGVRLVTNRDGKILRTVKIEEGV